MSPATAVPRAEPLALHGAALLVPSLQSEPFPVRAIRPAPCTKACPAGVNVKAYVSLIAERRFAEALEVIRRRCPLPGICGRVCHHPCELACRRRRADEAVAIRSLKRVVADRARDSRLPEPPPGPARGPGVAVIGSGPAGLTAAYDLRLAGYAATVFEGDPEPGGMLRYGIAPYRLPRDVLDAEIAVLERAGVGLRIGRRLGADFDLDGLFGQGFGAVLLAVGAQHGRRLGVPGEDGCAGVEDALEFLRRANAGDRAHPGERVVVIGGGSTAVEAARTARRLGASSVAILYRRYREEMLASQDEIAIAEQEQVHLSFLVAPARVIASNGRVMALECVRIGLGEPDASGRRRPIAIPGSEFLVPAERVLAAVGQEADLDFLAVHDRARLAAHGRLQADPHTSMTERRGVFAAGDVVTGPATVIEAIAAGHRAAESIRHFLEEGRPAVREERPELRAPREYELRDTPPIRASRVRPALALPEAGREFREVEQAFDLDEAVGEARRCLRCGPCGDCKICAPTCQRRHVMVRTASGGGAGGHTALLRVPGPFAMGLDATTPTPAWLMPRSRPTTLPEVNLAETVAMELRPVRVRIESDLCRGCATCAEVCPFDAITMTRRNGDIARARIEPALCRGCNLCTAVCPTKATRASALTPQWWGSRLADAFRFPAGVAPPAAVHVVLACQRRAGSLERPVEEPGVHVEIVRFRCIGQVDAGMLIELHALGARRVLVAGCSADRCRFGEGAARAAVEVARARALLGLLGAREDFIVWNPSDRRARDPLDAPVARLVREDAVEGPPGAVPPGGTDAPDGVDRVVIEGGA